MEYPESMQEFMDQFPTNAACRAYVAKIRWNGTPICSHCGGNKLWAVRRGVFQCRKCRRDTSVTAGTIFGDSRVPLRLWFQALWLLVSQKNGVSAQGLARALGIKREKTGWQLLRKIRSAMVRAGRERLSGTVEVDEVFLGGVKPGKRGRGAAGKVLILVAVEDKGKAGFGRIRISVISNAKSETLVAAIKTMVEPGSIVRTDLHASYPSITKHGYRHVAIDRESAIGEDPTPLVHRIASLLKRWLLGTHQGSVRPTHVASYLEEFVFRFNRRTSRSRGKLFYRLVQQVVAPAQR